MKSEDWSNAFKATLAIFCVGVLALVVSFFTDASLCLFYNITGIPCPACGMTRSYINLFQGNINQAFWNHPLFWIIPLIPIILFIDQRKPKWKLADKVFIPTIILFIVVWIIRVILFFPDTPPMERNSQAFLQKLLYIINGRIL